MVTSKLLNRFTMASCHVCQSFRLCKGFNCRFQFQNQATEWRDRVYWGLTFYLLYLDLSVLANASIPCFPCLTSMSPDAMLRIEAIGGCHIGPKVKDVEWSVRSLFLYKRGARKAFLQHFAFSALLPTCLPLALTLFSHIDSERWRVSDFSWPCASVF